jgi:hypothetical protein
MRSMCLSITSFIVYSHANKITIRSSNLTNLLKLAWKEETLLDASVVKVTAPLDHNNCQGIPKDFISVPAPVMEHRSESKKLAGIWRVFSFLPHNVFKRIQPTLTTASSTEKKYNSTIVFLHDSMTSLREQSHIEELLRYADESVSNCRNDRLRHDVPLRVSYVTNESSLFFWTIRVNDDMHWVWSGDNGDAVNLTRSPSQVSTLHDLLCIHLEMLTRQ